MFMRWSSQVLNFFVTMEPLSFPRMWLKQITRLPLSVCICMEESWGSCCDSSRITWDASVCCCVTWVVVSETWLHEAPNTEASACLTDWPIAVPSDDRFLWTKHHGWTTRSPGSFAKRRQDTVQSGHARIRLCAFSFTLAVRAATSGERWAQQHG